MSYSRARRAIEATQGTVVQVSDRAILEAKAVVDRSGIGCEPASAASVAGARQLLRAGAINPSDHVICILTGHLLKDSDTTLDYHMGKHGLDRLHANRPLVLDADPTAVRRALESYM